MASSAHILCQAVTLESHLRYCLDGFSSRCVHSRLFGSPSQPGAQAQYIRIPKAGGTLIKIDSLGDFGSIQDESLLLLADILPTGYFAASNALTSRNLEHLNGRKHLFFAVVGLGPVGLVGTCRTCEGREI